MSTSRGSNPSGEARLRHTYASVTSPAGNFRIESSVLLDGLVDAVLIADKAGVIRYANPAAASLLGTKLIEIHGRPLTTIIPERLRAQHATGFSRYLSERVPRLIGGGPVRLPVLRADGTEVDIELSLSAHRTDDGEELFLGTLRDLGERIELERQRSIASYLVTSREVMTRLISGVEPVTIEDAAPVLLSTLGEGLGWDGGSVWTREAGRNELRVKATWSATGDDIAEIMTSGVVLAAGEGLPGVVARDAEPSWIQTIATDTVFIRQDRARRAGARSCFAFPLLVAGDVHAVVEMYSRASQAPQPELLAILQAAGLEIGRHLERAQARRHLVEMAEALQSSLLPPLSPIVPGLDIAPLPGVGRCRTHRRRLLRRLSASRWCLGRPHRRPVRPWPPRGCPDRPRPVHAASRRDRSGVASIGPRAAQRRRSPRTRDGLRGGREVLDCCVPHHSPERERPRDPHCLWRPSVSNRPPGRRDRRRDPL